MTETVPFRDCPQPFMTAIPTPQGRDPIKVPDAVMVLALVWHLGKKSGEGSGAVPQPGAFAPGHPELGTGTQLDPTAARGDTLPVL